MSPEAVFHFKMQPKRWRLGLRPEPDPAGEAYSRPQSSIYGNLVQANICQTFAKFTSKMAGNTRKTFGGRAPPDLLGELTALPQTP